MRRSGALRSAHRLSIGIYTPYRIISHPGVSYFCDMRISWNWLCELVDIHESPEAFAERLTRAGLEVESISVYRRLPEALHSIIVGEVLAIEPHPAADKLLLTRIRLNGETIRTIITGARNLSVGDKVPVALPGSHIYKDGRWIRLEARPLRGILSEGMLCSEAELALGSDADGILRLPAHAPVGAPLTVVLEDYTDTILEISVTPNRGDALSHFGIAREYALLTGATFTLPQWHIKGKRITFPLTINVADPESCPRYGGVYVEGLEPGKVSPGWLRYRLEAVGLRSIHPVVDVTNYVLIGYGQPLHAFDGDKLVGKKLYIAPLSEATEMEGLGRQKLPLRPGDLLISDEGGAACLAGLLGGERTAISAQTQTAFIESAYFSPVRIRRTGRRLGLHTESGYRFMRGTDPELVPWAAEAAAALLQRIYPAAQVSEYHEAHDTNRTAPRRVVISLARLRQLTGLPLPESSVEESLRRLDIRIKSREGDQWHLEVPLYRLDITRPADIAEELLRISGWEALPLVPQPAIPYPRLSEPDLRFELRHNLSEVLTGMGFYEIRTNSLVSQTHLLAAENLQPLRLANPLYEELAYLRPTLIGSGLEVLLHNRNHGAVGFRAYEWGRIYHAEGEEERLALWVWGRLPFIHSGQKILPLEYLLAVIRALLQRIGTPFTETPLTPTQVWREGVLLRTSHIPLGIIGHLTESFLKAFHLKGEIVAAAEIYSECLRVPPRRMPYFAGISYHPIVIKDLSLYVPTGMSYASLVQRLEAMQHPYLKRIEAFDRYQDERGQRSYGLRFYLQSDHTLSEAEIHDFLRQAITALEAAGAQVRRADTV